MPRYFALIRWATKCMAVTRYRCFLVLLSIAMLARARVLLLGALFVDESARQPLLQDLYGVTELVPGMSTRDNAIAKLGAPSSTSNIGNSTILQWGGNNSSVRRTISFGMDGRMIQAATDAQNLDQLSGATH